MVQNTVQTKPTSAGSRFSRRLRWAGALAAGVVALAVVAYFTLTSSMFLKAWVVPRVGTFLNAQIAVREVALRPLSELRLQGLEVTPRDSATVLRAAEVVVRYRGFALMRGRRVLPEIHLERPELTVYVQPDGRSNLDPLLEPFAEPSPEPLQIDLGRLTLRQASVSYCLQDPAGGRQCTLLTNLDLTLSDLKNGGAARLTLHAGFAQENTSTSGPPDTVRARVEAETTLRLSEILGVREATGAVRLEVTEAGGQLSVAEDLRALLAVDMTGDEIRQCDLRFERQGQALGEVRLNGPLNLERREGRLHFQIRPIGRAALALVGAPLGVDLGETTLSGNGFVDLANRGHRYTSAISLRAERFSLARGARKTPTLDWQVELRGFADLNASVASIERLQVSARTAGRDLLTVTNQRAINLGWGRGDPRATAPAFVHVALTDLHLADWQSWLGETTRGGVVNLRGTVTIAQDGRNLSAELTHSLSGLTVLLGDQSLPDLGLEFTGRLILNEYRRVGLENGRLRYLEAGVPLWQAQLSASADPFEGNGNVQFNAEGSLSDLLLRHPVPNLSFERGHLRLNTLLNWSRNRTAGGITAYLTDVAGRVGAYRLEGYSAEAELAGELADDKATLRRLSLQARDGVRSGGSALLTGQVDAAAQTARFTFNLSGLNHLALRPFLAGLTNPVQIASFTLSANGEMRYDARGRPSAAAEGPEAFRAVFDALREGRGETTLRLSSSLTDLVLTNRLVARATAPLGFGLQLDVNRQGQTYTLGTNLLHLPPTPRATNTVSLTGLVDLAATNPAPARLNLHAAAVDLTPWMAWADLWSAPASTPASGPEEEPAPVELPLARLTAEMQVDQLYLGELSLRDWQLRVDWNRGRLTLAPCKFMLLDAPVTADLKLDLTRPGYVYEAALDLARLPLAPLVDTFATNYAGQIRGELFSRLQLAGVGITGPNLQRHLRGQVWINATNLNYQVLTPRARSLVNTLAMALGLDDLMRSPLTLLTAQLDIRDGQVQVRPFVAASDAYVAMAEGTIRLAPVLTNSPLELPVQLALREDLARKARITVPAGGTQNNFVALPPFVKVGGTLGAPDTHIDKLRLTALVAGSVGSAIGGTAGNAVQGVGSLLQGNVESAVGTLGALLQGRRPGESTNVPPATGVTNPPPAGANAPASAVTNAPPARTNPPARPRVLDLLDSLRPNN